MQILDNSSLSEVFCKFSQPVACILIILTLSFTEQKFLIQWSPTYHFLIHGFFFGEQNLSNLKLPKFPLMLSSKSFIVLHFTVRSMIHFELILVICVRSVSRYLFFFLHVEVQLFQHHLLSIKRLSFLYWIALTLLTKISWPYACVSILGLTILFHYWFVYSFTDTTLSWLSWFYSKSWGWVVSILQLWSLL